MLYLIQEDLVGLPIIHLSRFITARKSDYYTLRCIMPGCKTQT